MSRRPTGNYSMESSKINLLGERRKGEGEKGRIKKERDKKEEKGGKRGKEKSIKKIKREREKRKNRKAKMNRHVWERFMYIQQ